ncbi:MAG: Holliday junction branch migration protein RuvA [Methanopyri archaeon]|jgi:Holliday junction DNA helicase RuvA|nr:Holliday junction branch migration protein RuvA [Methanopyri archaeon]
MIWRLAGVLEDVGDGFAVVRSNDVSYQVQVPSGILDKLRVQLDQGPEQAVTFHTLHYLEGGSGPGPLLPRLIGFLNPVARDFFQLFITVQGIGPKRALRALTLPISEIAAAIEAKDKATLTRLPGIGNRAAEKVIAELNGKMARFALLREPGAQPRRETDIGEEAQAVLRQLGYSRPEAQKMVSEAIARLPGAAGADELIAEVFRRVRG